MRNGVWSSGQNKGGNGQMGQTFLRCPQMTKAADAVALQTIFPGWYRARTTQKSQSRFVLGLSQSYLIWQYPGLIGRGGRLTGARTLKIHLKFGFILVKILHGGTLGACQAAGV